MCVHVLLSEKDMGQVDDLGTTTPVFLDSLTGGLALIREHSCTVLSSLLVFILHSLCTSVIPHFILWCSCYPSASCISHGLSSQGPWWNGVRSLHQKIYKIMKKTPPYCVLLLHAALVCHFLSTHSNMCEWACTCTCMHADTHICMKVHVHIHSWLLHTSFNTYRCRALWFS